LASIFCSVSSRAPRVLAERGPALPARLHVPILDGIDELPDQVQPEAPGLAALEGLRRVHRRTRRRVEALGVVLDHRHLDAAGSAGKLHAHRRLALPAVFDHVCEKLFQHEVHGGPKPLVDPLGAEGVGGEGEELVHGGDVAPEGAAGTHAGRFLLTSTTVMSSSCGAPCANAFTASKSAAARASIEPAACARITASARSSPNSSSSALRYSKMPSEMTAMM